jgi:UDP-galactopyranose mutase
MVSIPEYDYLIVGAGLFGAVFAREMTDRGFQCLVIDKRPHPAGNCHTEERAGIRVHTYGPHIFHTADEEVWRYVNRFASFNHFVNRPKVHYRGKLYSFPINLMTLYQLWGVRTPAEAEDTLREKRIPATGDPRNMEEWVLSQVGREIYEIFIRGYTRKQWKRDPRDLPATIIKRIPIRLNFDDNYYTHPHQGIPQGGYTRMVDRMLEGIDVRLGVDYLDHRDEWNRIAGRIVYTGRIDEFFDYRFGELEYRTLEFETTLHEDVHDFQGNAVINYTEFEIPYTRVIEHKHFEPDGITHTVVTKEYPAAWRKDRIPYYPVNDQPNTRRYEQYREWAGAGTNIVFGGRLGEYRYYDMDQVVASALKAARHEALKGRKGT